MPTSKSETLFRRFFAHYFPFLKAAYGIRPTAKPNKYNKQGRRQCNLYGIELEGLEIDLYVPDIRLGIEWQGNQHYAPTRRFHNPTQRRTWWQKLLGLTLPPDRQAMIDNHLKQLDRDRRKLQLCEAHGIRLMTFDHNDGEPGRFERRMREVADYARKYAANRLATNPNDPTYKAMLHHLNAVRWHQASPKEWFEEWRRLARPGVRSKVVPRRRKPGFWNLLKWVITTQP